ncbi:MAG: hypothetical protein HQL46_12895 [Gammaproteobacteria bacterium]|nr:hypothetical protein [Gammaproteobacteria bacterium]
MQSIKQTEWVSLPEQAQREVYDFFLTIKKKYATKSEQKSKQESEILAFSNHSANTISEWLDDAEDDVWK